MQHVSVKLKKLNENAIVPKYGTPYAAGADLYACEGKDVTVEPHQTVFIHTGVAIEIPPTEFPFLKNLCCRDKFSQAFPS